MNPTCVRVVTVVLALIVAAPSAYADTLFRRSIDKAVAAEVQANRRAARDENPHKAAAITLLSAGAGLVILGFTMPSGVECTDNSTSRTISIDCGTKANKGLLFAGVGAAGLGGFLYMKGERQRATPRA